MTQKSYTSFHAYLPGHNERHLEDAFDAIRATAEAGLSVSQLADCEAFVTGLRFLEQGYFWEAHEVLEPVWMALPDDSVERRFVQGLIQFANGRLKLRMGKAKAALRLVGRARSLLPQEPCQKIMTLQVDDVRSWLEKLEEEIILAL